MKVKKGMLLLQGLCLLLVLNSCAGPKMILAEDMKEGAAYDVTVNNEMRIQCEDKLSISVYSANQELVIPFNRGSFRVDTEGEVSSTDPASRPQLEGYVVNSEGNIDFPVLGKIHAEGLTREELSDYIKQNLISRNLISDPLVTTELLNLKIPVLGEVQNVSVLTASEGRMTIVEAITKAGGLTGNALAEKISVIRTEGKVRKVFVVNFRSKNIFDSPAYYLQQNDIVFVHSQSAKATESENRNWRAFTAVISVLSLAVPVIWYLKK